jgi:hypothetical protein
MLLRKLFALTCYIYSVSLPLKFSAPVGSLMDIRVVIHGKQRVRMKI